MLDSIFKTIDSIKKKFPYFKIKVASVQLEHLYEGDGEELVKLLSTYNVAQLNFDKVNDNYIKGVP